MKHMNNRPNILLITSDDLGRHLGCYGIATVDTPNIDRLASQGVRFARSFCAAPQCSPSRAALATGRVPHSNGVMGLTHADFAWDLHEGEVHLARHLADAGYHTARTGKVHDYRSGEANHRAHGFAETLTPEGAEAEPDARAIRLARRARRFLDERAEDAQPFYLQLDIVEPHRDPRHPSQFYATHLPARSEVTVPPHLRDDEAAREEMAFFEASVRTLDEAVGEVLEALESGGLAQNTLVLFTADHGIPFPRAKCSLYDPGLEIPMILRWPEGPLAAGHTSDALVSNVDCLPTLLELLGLEAPAGIQGQSFAPALQGGDWRGRDAIFAEMTYHEYFDPIRAIRTDRHKLLVNFSSAPSFMDPSQQWRSRTTPKVPVEPRMTYHPAVELYDLADDPHERENLADDAAHSDTRRQLLRRLREWMTETSEPLLQWGSLSPMHRRALGNLRDAGIDR